MCLPHGVAWALGRIVLCVVLLCVVLLGGGCQRTADRAVSVQRSDALARELRRYDGAHAEAVRRAYAASGAAPSPLWGTPRGPSDRARALLRRLCQAGRDGLSPRRYRAPALAEALRHAFEASAADSIRYARQARADIALTEAFVRAARDLSGGALNPRHVQHNWRLNDSPADVVAVLHRALDRSTEPGGVAATLSALAARHPGYADLRAAYTWYRRLDAAGGWPTLPDTIRLQRGDTTAVAALLDRLDATHDLPPEAANRSAPAVYNAAVAAGVRHFQARHGLDTTGVVNAATRQALNVPARERARTLALNLERHRWLPETARSTLLMVNVSGFRLFGYRAGQREFSMPVIVGERGWETPVFADTLTHVVFRPYWNVPKRIALEELLPTIRADSSVLQRNGYEVVGPDGTVVPAERLSRKAIEDGAVRIRQKPGPANALGRVKFLFPNAYNIYLHDTPADHLFRRSDRAFSHGCIRVARPVHLADFVLPDAWPRERIRASMQPDAPRRYVRLEETLPVYVLYLTAWPAPDGDVQFRTDPYRYDEDLRASLPLPDANATATCQARTRLPDASDDGLLEGLRSTDDGRLALFAD